ncbi:MAG: hypothetical protein HY865_00705 [Chloroflexi bacterium]|nr:hypothetical protein [Chloroflexota bacterium]
MKPINQETNSRRGIIRLKRNFGMLYGAVAGAAFAIISWGWDGYKLSVSHAYHPWIMLVTGLMFCVIVGGIAGWLTARSESSLLGVLFWIIASAGFAWLMVALPLQINPAIVSRLDPQLGALVNYDGSGDFSFRFGAALAWILPFALLVGVTQLPVTESAVFAATPFGRIAPLFLCVLLMGISGMFTDSLINAHFRNAISALDTTIQFVADNRDNEKANPALSRELHARALWEVRDLVKQSRQLFVGGYSEDFGELHILVKFEDQWVDCLVLYNQPNLCKAVTRE